MNYPDVDDVLNYLSTKFNKIFCDREFVCCVIQDFQTILNNKHKCCVLVFPALGPIYLKAVRYQARIFDLAVFSIGGKFKLMAVCHKNHLKKNNEFKGEPITMAEVPASRRKRPERQLYVPPAQRKSRLSREKCDSVKVENSSEDTSELRTKNGCVEVVATAHESIHFRENAHFRENTYFPLGDIVSTCYYLNLFRNGSVAKIVGDHRAPNCHQNCQFKRYLNANYFGFKYDNCIPLYTLTNNFQIDWKLNDLYGVAAKSRGDSTNWISYPFFDFNLDVGEVEADKSPAVLQVYNRCDCELLLSNETDEMYKIVCDRESSSETFDIVDLSVIDLGHCFIVVVDDSSYFFECQEDHEPAQCCINKIKELKRLASTRTSDDDNNKKNATKDMAKATAKRVEKSTKTSLIKSKISTSANDKKTPNNKNEHEEEKEIMRKTQENINRKIRPIMKYVDDANSDTLKIDKNDGVSNWEDLFDDDGQIQEKLLTEIVDKVGNEVTVVKASEDYTAYANKPTEDLEHIVELYDFPPTLATPDLIQPFSYIDSDAMYIKWVDDTHALLVLGTFSQAQKALTVNNPLIKVRPMTAASAVALHVANHTDLKPAMKRPPTNLQTARRLITSHLGTKSKLSKEQMAKERQVLKEAREMKRLIKQNERDAWEGNIRSAVN